MIKDIYIEFTKPVKLAPLSSTIRLVQGTKYSHVRITWTTSSGRVVVYEASGLHVRFLGTLAQEQNKVEVIKKYKISFEREEYRKLVDTCLKYAHVKYGISQLIGIGLVKLFNLDKNPLSKGEYSQVCSEIVARILREAKGWELSTNLDIAGPKEIDEELQKLLINEDLELVHG